MSSLRGWKKKHEGALIDRSSVRSVARRRTSEMEETLMSANNRFSVFAISVLDLPRKNRSAIAKGGDLYRDCDRASLRTGCVQ